MIGVGNQHPCQLRLDERCIFELKLCILLTSNTEQMFLVKYIIIAVLAVCSASSVAQPVLTAVTNNPVAGDTLAQHQCHTAGVAIGASGAGVTWDFHTLTALNTIVYRYVDCSTTVYCDSFPGSGLAAEATIGGTAVYEYLSATSSALEYLGYIALGSTTQHYYKPQIANRYPVVYGETSIDTDVVFSYGGATSTYTIELDTNVEDGYGTLILPSISFPNALRCSTVAYRYDSVPGFPPTYSGYFQRYSWYSPDFKFCLLQITLDSSSGAGLGVANIFSPFAGSTSGMPSIARLSAVTVGPNPAVDVLHIGYESNGDRHPSMVLYDVTGNGVRDLGQVALSIGHSDVICPVGDLPSGVYFLKILDGDSCTVQKVVVNH